MSNDVTRNPIRIDTVGTVTTDRHNILAFNVIPSNTNWNVDLFATGSAYGARLFSAFGADKRSYNLSLGKPKPTQGIEAVTLTNITEVDVYTDASD